MKNFALPVVSFFLACIGATPLAVAQARPHLTQSSGGVTDPVVNDTWKGGTGNWSAAANWSAGVPNNGTPSGTTYNVFFDGGNPAKSAVTRRQRSPLLSTCDIGNFRKKPRSWRRSP